MTDAVLAALESRAKGAPSASPPPETDAVEEVLRARAGGENFAAKTSASHWNTAPFEAVGGALLNIGSSMIAVPAAGLSGLGGSLLQGVGLTEGDPAENVRQIQEQFTYQPAPGTAAARGVEALSSPLNPLTWPGRAGEFLGEKYFDLTGEPIGASLLEAAPDTAMSALGVKGAKTAVRAIPETPPKPSGSAFGADSLSAAAASPELQTVRPELRAQIEKIARESGVNREVVTRHVEADSLPVPIRLTKGQATQDPTQLSLEQNARGKNPELARVFNEQNQQLIDNLDEMRASVAPKAVGQDPVQNGQALIDAYKLADEPIRADINAKYKALEEANGGQFPLDGASFVKAADAALAKKMKGRYVPAQVAGDLAELRDGGPMTFETFENLRTNLAAEARKAERSGDGNAASAINIVRESLESLPIEGEAAKVKPLADAARAAAKARFDRLRADPAYRAAVDDGAPIGELSPLADNFVDKYVVKGKAAHLQEMRRNLGENPEAVETIAAGALNYLKSKAGINAYTNEGNFSQAGYNRALSELTPKLGLLVDQRTAEQVQALGNVARYVMAQPRGSFVNTSNTFVAAAKEHAASTLEGMANVAAHGIPVGTMARKKLQQRSEQKFVKEATEPAAGAALKDLLKKERT